MTRVTESWERAFFAPYSGKNSFDDLIWYTWLRAASYVRPIPCYIPVEEKRRIFMIDDSFIAWYFRRKRTRVRKKKRARGAKAHFLAPRGILKGCVLEIPPDLFCNFFVYQISSTQRCLRTPNGAGTAMTEYFCNPLIGALNFWFLRDIETIDFATCLRHRRVYIWQKNSSKQDFLKCLTYYLRNEQSEHQWPSQVVLHRCLPDQLTVEWQFSSKNRGVLLSVERWEKNSQTPRPLSIQNLALLLFFTRKKAKKERKKR